MNIMGAAMVFGHPAMSRFEELQPIKNQPRLVSYWLLLYYLPVNSCFSIPKENRTAATAVPIDAMSAIIAIFSSRENWVEHDNKSKRGES
ncbi:MAG TPA: hypothetical protein VFQ98_04900 [Gallionella sp.]|nr:hypothetical protein [Gallionella sp.]